MWLLCINAGSPFSKNGCKLTKNINRRKEAVEDEKKNVCYVWSHPEEPRLVSTWIVYSVKSDWLNAQCEVSLSTQMLSDTLRGTRLTITIFAIDNSWEQPVHLCFGRNGVNTYLSGLPWSASKRHAWGERREKRQGNQHLSKQHVFLSLWKRVRRRCISGSNNLTLPIT